MFGKSNPVLNVFVSSHAANTCRYFTANTLIESNKSNSDDLYLLAGVSLEAGSGLYNVIVEYSQRPQIECCADQSNLKNENSRYVFSQPKPEKGRLSASIIHYVFFFLMVDYFKRLFIFLKRKIYYFIAKNNCFDTIFRTMKTLFLQGFY
jgi:hypothetical protein